MEINLSATVAHLKLELYRQRAKVRNLLRVNKRLRRQVNVKINDVKGKKIKRKQEKPRKRSLSIGKGGCEEC
ncbi:hypothetical protein DPMN_035190 [Dreissena polymorpha]|uniref:Uncharacterized protein n=1 Tax=Dreissena polymorpha TaxID=45954 RepID=A0A9D4M926_DREPO|nr:hypothetical protein DPMN_035190 [Dreissena polymorpha]